MAEHLVNQQLLSIICNVFDAHSAVLFMPGEDGRTFRMAGCFSLSDKIVTDIAIAPGQGLAGWIIRNGEPLLINNFDQKRGVLGYYQNGEETRIRAFMGCPLENGMGALCLDSMRTYSFSAKDQKILHQFGQFIVSLDRERRQCATDGSCFTYYNALRAVQAMRLKTPRWSRFLDGFLEIVAKASGMTTCFLTVRGETGTHFHMEGATRPPMRGDTGAHGFAMGSGVIGWVFNNGVPVFSGERESPSRMPLFGRDVVTPPFTTIVCLPLLVHKKTRGVLVLADERSLNINDPLKEFLGLVADNLALFLENLYLRNRLTSQAGTE
ncbi:GAF domain protein [Alkalidesulfovibrio alkalitolerans DSM 16529]|jgi:signal transduction protein with GAF and PtsI domain|uniref:GAF domain protein n=1 Tax=Alkalidesulfovibrio alkalitolerans DSM 16529 TaxID=1121439 RepID=S7T1P1_9BACT|nr:GAF domain-containing protein [Alkalidesulfovibrio alkalitolerans]EPR30425.1 GAF domain protein [Alkalidesulfovibrio alkalitolerans DSM 16529]